MPHPRLNKVIELLEQGNVVFGGGMGIYRLNWVRAGT